MTTYLGRVVYDRPKHVFNITDAVRVTKAISETDGIKDVADTFAQMQFRYLADREATWLEGMAFILRLLTTTAVFREWSVKHFLKQLQEALKIGDWLGVL